MKRSKNYQLPEIKIIHIKEHIMFDRVSKSENGEPDSIRADFEEEGKSNE